MSNLMSTVRRQAETEEKTEKETEPCILRHTHIDSRLTTRKAKIADAHITRFGVDE